MQIYQKYKIYRIKKILTSSDQDFYNYVTKN